LAISALALGSVAHGQEGAEAKRQSFRAATADHLLDAVQTCEASKASQSFDTAKVRELGWRQLSTSAVKPQDQTMFGKKANGASITIAGNADGTDRVCLIIGWVNGEAIAEAAKNRIASELGVAFETETPDQAEAEADGWAYTFLTLTKPKVTDQTRVMFFIAPAKVIPDPEGNL
jgi:hypothetical protein